MIGKRYYILVFLFLVAGVVGAEPPVLQNRIKQISVACVQQKANAKECEEEFLKLLPECKSAQEKGLIFTAIAQAYSRNIAVNASNLLFYCEKALEHPMDASIASQLHVYAGNVHEIEARLAETADLASQKRKEAATSYLKALELVARHLEVADLRELTANGYPRVDIVAVPEKDPDFERLKEQQNEQSAAFEYALRQKQLLQMRTMIVGRVRALFPSQDVEDFRILLHGAVTDPSAWETITKILKE